MPVTEPFNPLGPVIRVEVEGIKHQLVHYLGQFQEQWTKMATEAVDKAMNGFDFERVAYEEAVRQLDGVVRDEVKKAAARVVADMIEAKMVEAFGDPLEQARRQPR